MPARRMTVRVDGAVLSVSNLDKVLFPGAGVTKAQVLRYYLRAAPALLPHMRARPLVLRRSPHGTAGASFYQRACPEGGPAGLRAVHVAGARHCVVDRLPGLVFLVDLGAIEVHPFLCRADRPKRPDWVVFDLDPGPPADAATCADVALRLARTLEGVGLRSFAKSSGGAGLQVYVPIARAGATFAATRRFARTVAAVLESDEPDLVVSTMGRSRRVGRVLVDWAQNAPFKSTVCAYSVRARDPPTVSMPLSWAQVGRVRSDASRALVAPAEALRRLSRSGDRFAPVLALRQRLPGDA